MRAEPWGANCTDQQRSVTPLFKTTVCNVHVFGLGDEIEALCMQKQGECKKSKQKSYSWPKDSNLRAVR